MLVPDSLTNIVTKAKAALDVQPQFALSPVHRQRIYAALMLLDKPSPLGWLGITTARYVLPIWQYWRPSDLLASESIQTAEKLLQGTIASSFADNLSGRGWERLEDLGAGLVSPTDRNGLYAGTAAVSALYDALGRNPFKDVELREQDTDSDLDPWSSDTALWSAAAYSGRLFDPTSNLANRHTFWTWWLSEVVVLASEND